MRGPPHSTISKWIRRLGPAGLALAAAQSIACAADGEITVSGVVLDSSTRSPIVGAVVEVGDREFDDQLDRYLDDPEFALRLVGRTDSDENGRFFAASTLAGRGRHEVWVVTQHPQYQDQRLLIWKGRGFPDDASREVTLEMSPR